MPRQFGVTLRNALLTSLSTSIGASPKLRILTGTQPATCATAQSGTLLVEITLPATWMGAPSAGVSLLSGVWSGTVTADGTAGYYRFLDSAGSVCHEQGKVTAAIAIATSALTAAASAVLNFASTTGVVIGQGIVGTGIPVGATVSSLTATTVTMTAVSGPGVTSGAVVYFGDTTGEMWLPATALLIGQSGTITSRTLTAPGA